MRKQIEVAYCDFPVAAPGQGFRGDTCGEQREQMSVVQLTKTDGTVVEVDLCPAHWQALMAHARPAGQFGPRASASVTVVPAKPSAAERKAQLAPARAWAAECGVEVPSRGVFPAEVLAMFERGAEPGELQAWAASRPAGKNGNGNGSGRGVVVPGPRPVPAAAFAEAGS